MIAKIALCAFLSVAILTTGVSAQSALPDGATLAWAENFDALESARWSHGLAWGLDYDSGLQRYRPENVTVENGALTIRAKPQASGDPARPWTSGAIHSCRKISVQYGWVFARVRSDGLPGEWAALYLTHDTYSLYGDKDKFNTFELDLIETQGTRPTQILQNFHSYTPHHYTREKWSNVGNVSDWHIVGVRWSPSGVSYWIDGVKRHEVKTPVVRFPACIAIALTVGGWERGNHPAPDYAGAFQVDWIHWYTWPNRVHAS